LSFPIVVFWRRISRQAAPSQAIFVMNQTLNGGVTAGLLFKRPSSPTAFPRQDSLTAPTPKFVNREESNCSNLLCFDGGSVSRLARFRPSRPLSQWSFRQTNIRQRLRRRISSGTTRPVRERSYRAQGTDPSV
jgi:hypothetical protein